MKHLHVFLSINCPALTYLPVHRQLLERPRLLTRL